MALGKAPEQTCAVVTDASCDLPAETLAALGVGCCPEDAKVIDLIELYRALFEQGFREIVSVHASSYVPQARAAAAAAGDSGAVTVVDARLLSAALAIVVERAAFAAASGASGEQVAAVAESVAGQVVFYVVSDPRAPRQGNGGLKDRMAYLRRRALGTRNLVRITAEEHKVMAESEDLPHLTGLLSQTLSACSRRKGSLCYIEAAGTSPASLERLEKPLDTNEYVSHCLSKIIPAPALVSGAGPDCVGIAVVPEDVFGDHAHTLFV